MSDNYECFSVENNIFHIIDEIEHSTPSTRINNQQISQPDASPISNDTFDTENIILSEEFTTVEAVWEPPTEQSPTFSLASTLHSQESTIYYPEIEQSSVTEYLSDEPENLWKTIEEVTPPTIALSPPTTPVSSRVNSEMPFRSRGLSQPQARCENCYQELGHFVLDFGEDEENFN